MVKLICAWNSVKINYFGAHIHCRDGSTLFGDVAGLSGSLAIATDVVIATHASRFKRRTFRTFMTSAAPPPLRLRVGGLGLLYIGPAMLGIVNDEPVEMKDCSVA